MSHHGPRCPCGKQAVLKIWEAPGVILCGYHAKKWLRSEEKKVIGEILNEGDPNVKSALDHPVAHAALLRFMASVERDANRWEKLMRWLIRPILRWILGGPRG